MKNLFLYFLATGLVCACGIQKVAENTHGEVKKTNTAIEESNKKQERLLEEMRHLRTETARLQALTSEMLKQMNTTNAAIHLQTLTVAMQQLLSSANTESLNPPALMMAPATAFAKEATSEEIIEVAYTFLNDATKGYQEQRDQNGDVLAPLRIRSRMVTLMAAQAIAAFTPQEKFQDILRAQITVGGRYQDATYSFIVCRYVFMHDYLFNAVLENTEHFNLDFLREMNERYRALKYIAALPYQDRLKLRVPKLQVTQAEGKIKVVAVEKRVNASELPGKGEAAAGRIQRGLSSAQLQDPEIQRLLKELNPNVR